MATQVIVLSERVLAKQVESILDLEEQIKSLKEQKDKLADNIKSLMDIRNGHIKQRFLNNVQKMLNYCLKYLAYTKESLIIF